MSRTPSLTAEDCRLYGSGLVSTTSSTGAAGGDWDLTGWNQAGEFLLGIPTCSEVCRDTRGAAGGATGGGVILRHLWPGDIGLAGGGDRGLAELGDSGRLASGGSGGFSLTSGGRSRLSSDGDFCLGSNMFSLVGISD